MLDFAGLKVARLVRPLMRRRFAVGKPTFKVIVVMAALLVIGGLSSARSHSTDPMDWLIQHVCVDAADRPIPADPYYGCPTGSRERRLRLDDPMPYLRHDQPGKNGDHPDGYHRHDARPMIDLHSGAVVSANDFDFDYTEPYGVMHPGDGDGFDVYRVANGYASAEGTRDGGGYSQTFFGPDCRPFGGWIYFPVSFLKSLRPGASGRGVFPARDDYWEQNGEPWPGRCSRGQGFAEDTLTTWEYIPAYPFAGHNGSPTKYIDAIVSTHGLPLRTGPLPRFHLERFYFTDLYGPTRWEAWSPDADPPKASDNCGGDTRITYEGVPFTLTGCRDWTLVKLIDPPRQHRPWPYPEANLLKNWHFDLGGIAPWKRIGAKSELGYIINWGQFVSRGPSDLRLSQNQFGVRYLQVNCDGRQCNPDQLIYQDLPLANLRRSAVYDYGFSGVIDGSEDGTMKVTLSQRDREGKELWSTSFDAVVKTSYRGKKAADSVYNASSVFLETSPPIVLKPGASALRFSLSPRSPVQYDILDTWVMPH